MWDKWVNQLPDKPQWSLTSPRRHLFRGCRLPSNRIQGPFNKVSSNFFLNSTNIFSKFNAHIITKFCTIPNSSAVGACAKFCGDPTHNIHVMTHITSWYWVECTQWNQLLKRFPPRAKPAKIGEIGCGVNYDYSWHMLYKPHVMYYISMMNIKRALWPSGPFHSHILSSKFEFDGKFA